MPVFDIEPGTNPKAAGTLHFYAEGSDPSTGVALTSDGAITSAGIRLPTGDVTPQDHGLETWTYDPLIPSGTVSATNGRVYLAKLMIRRAVTVSKVWWSVTSAAVTPAAGQNWVGIYSSAGTLLASAGVDADTTSVGPKGTSITPTALTPGFVWAAFLFNAATPVGLPRTSTFEGTPNIGLTSTALRSAVNGAGATTLAASINPASNSTVGSVGLFAALEAVA